MHVNTAAREEREPNSFIMRPLVNEENKQINKHSTDYQTQITTECDHLQIKHTKTLANTHIHWKSNNLTRTSE